MEIHRKNIFIAKVRKSDNPKIVKKWEFCQSSGGVVVRNEEMTKEEFLSYIMDYNNYVVMTFNKADKHKYQVYDKFQGAIYCFEVEL